MHWNLHSLCLSCSRSPCCVLLALSWNTAGGGDSIYGVVKCLSPYFTQEWAFLTNFFAEYTCHRNKWELEAKNWFIEVKNIPKKRSLLKSFLKGPASNQEFLKCATTIQEIPKWASSNQEFLKCATTNREFLKCATTNREFLKCAYTIWEFLKRATTNREFLRWASPNGGV